MKLLYSKTATEEENYWYQGLHAVWCDGNILIQASSTRLGRNKPLVPEQFGFDNITEKPALFLPLLLYRLVERSFFNHKAICGTWNAYFETGALTVRYCRTLQCR